MILFKKINNKYFHNQSNKENLLFVFEISKKLNINQKKFIDVVQNFKGLKYRQQIIFNKNK